MVGWFTLGPTSGPNSDLLPIQRQITTSYTEAALLVVVHPDMIADPEAHTSGGRLPLSVYECVVEEENVKEDRPILDGPLDTSRLRYRYMPYSVETDETEMIAINYVAKGAGSAAALIEEEPPPSPGAAERTEKKGKRRADTREADMETNQGVKEVNTLTTEEEDQIAGITTRLNSIRMLQSRLRLMSEFLMSLPPSKLSNATNENMPDPIYLPHLRSIQALVSRLSLLTPGTDTSVRDVAGFMDASQGQSNDVTLASLLSLISHDVQSLSEMGRKFSAVEGCKNQKSKNKAAFTQNTFGGMEEQDDGGIGGYGMSHMMA